MSSLVWSRKEFNEESRRLFAVFQNVGLEESTSSTDFRFLMDWSVEPEDTNATTTGGNDVYWKHPPVVRQVLLPACDENGNQIREDNRASFDDEVEEEDCLCDDTILQDDQEVLFSSTQSTNTTTDHRTTKWYFDIVYSDTWKAPVLYFTVDNDHDGSPCPRSDVVKMLMTFSHYNRVDDAWEFLSHEEHPVSRCPSFFLHPCQTMERLQTLQSTDTSTMDNDDASSPPLLLWSWMSLIFPSVGYSIPSKIFQELCIRCRTTKDTS